MYVICIHNLKYLCCKIRLYHLNSREGGWKHRISLASHGQQLFQLLLGTVTRESSNYPTRPPENMTIHSCVISCKLLGVLGSKLMCCFFLKRNPELWVMPTAVFWVNTSQTHKQSASNSDGATFVKPIYVEIARAAPKSARTETHSWI